MIRYTLRCDQGHDFESWFASASAYETLQASGHVSCALCGSSSVEKALMAPAVKQGKTVPAPEAPTRAEIEAKLKALREQVEKNSDYVGTNFATEARAMHLGEVPERAIWGEARIDEAKALVDEGVPVAPLPFVPKSRTN
jgi:hypothetical protein